MKCGMKQMNGYLIEDEPSSLSDSKKNIGNRPGGTNLYWYEVDIY